MDYLKDNPHEGGELVENRLVCRKLNRFIADWQRTLKVYFRQTLKHKCLSNPFENQITPFLPIRKINLIFTLNIQVMPILSANRAEIGDHNVLFSILAGYSKNIRSISH
jgi:hypothetical protein